MSSESSSIKNLSDDKLLSFAIGQNKKSRFQKDREDKELKRKQDEEDAAKVYQSFAADFNPDEDVGPKRFVRAGESLDASVEERPGIKASQNKLSEMDKMMLELKDHEKAQDGEREERRQRKASFDVPVSSSSAKKTRNMDEMLDEFKSKHDDPSFKSFKLPEVGYSSHDAEKGSFDIGDPYTTNLHVGNINPATTEEILTKVFAHYGEINSVKIMWPRSEEERARNRNTGFVSFKRRADADAARRELDKSILAGHELIVGWGKAVKISSAPVAPIVLSTNFANLLNPSVYPNLPIVPSAAVAPLPLSSSSRWDEQPSGKVTLEVHSPANDKLKAAIDIIAGYVAADGEAFEKELMQREANNPFFNFLYPPGHSHHSHDLHLYYRWRVYVNLMPYEQCDQVFQMTVGGPWIQPPQHASVKANELDGMKDEEEGSLDGRRSRSRSPSMDSSDHDHSRRRKRKRRSRSRSRGRDRHREEYKDMTGAQIERIKDKARLARRARLDKDDYEAFKDLLRNLTLSRIAIKQSMGFAFDHIEHAEDIINIIKDKLIKCSSYPAVKIAGLYLLSDILHNSASPIKYATNYRIQIEKYIPEVIEHISLSLRAATGRMSALAIEERVKKVLSAWETWSIFPERFLLGLEIIFMMNENDLQVMQTLPIDLNSDESEEEVRERLQKKAKGLGIAVSEMSSNEEIMRKIAFVEMKIKKRQAPSSLTAPAASTKTTEQQQQLLQQSEAEKATKEDIDGAPLQPPVTEDDVDGQPMELDDDIDGVPLSTYKAEDDDDIDGAPMQVDETAVVEEEEDVDGMPMNEDEDIDGVPLT